MFSKTCEYGIRACIYIATQTLSNKKVSLTEVSHEIESPQAYTSKILQRLGRNHIIQSDKGPGGGFFMLQPQIEQTTLLHIVYAIDGEGIFNGCGLGLKDCNASKPCPVHNHFVAIRTDLKNMLQSTFVNALALEYKQGLSYLKR